MLPRHNESAWQTIEIGDSEVELITMEELRLASFKIRSGKASGPDYILLVLAKIFADTNIEDFLKMLNELLVEGNFTRGE